MEEHDLINCFNDLKKGETLQKALTNNFVSMTEFFKALDADSKLAREYQSIVTARAHGYVEEIISIADDIEEDVQRSKLKIDTRKWLASKLIDTYADRQRLDVTSTTIDIRAVLDAAHGRVISAGFERLPEAVGNDEIEAIELKKGVRDVL